MRIGARSGLCNPSNNREVTKLTPMARLVNRTYQLWEDYPFFTLIFITNGISVEMRLLKLIFHPSQFQNAIRARPYGPCNPSNGDPQ